MARSFKLFIRSPVVYITLITILDLQQCRIWSTANKVNRVCNTEECKKLGAMYKNNLNSLGRPCTDFYDYVCHGWGQQFPKPKDRIAWNVGEKMQLEVHMEMKKLLEDKKVSNMGDFEEAKAVYRACMNIPYLKKSDPEVLKKIMNSVAVWPMIYPRNQEPPLSNLLCWVVDQLYIKIAGESALFDFKITAYEYDTKELSTVLTHLKSPYGMIERFAPWDKENEIQNYKQFIKNIISKVALPNYNISNEAFQNDFTAVFNFREKLRQIIEKRRSEKLVRVPLKMYQLLHNKESNSQANAIIDWLLVLRAIHKTPTDPNGLRITETTTLYVQEEYFSDLAKLLGDTERRVIVNHIHLYFLERHIKIDPSLRILLKDSVTLGVDTTAIIRNEPDRWETCIENNNMKVQLGREYLSASLSHEKKAAVNALIDEAKQILRQQIDECNWLGDRGIRAEIRKVNKIQQTIGYTESRSTTALDSMTVNARYMPDLNKIYVTAAFLKPPMYIEHVPFEITYGATMSILGHELYHAFDSRGILFDGNGVFSPMSQQKSGAYLNQTNCFNNFFTEFKKTHFKKHDMCPSLVYYSKTLEEDMADAMGLKLAYRGYKNKLKTNNGTCEVLPGFENFSCDQLFFIANANIMCSDSSIIIKESQLFCDVHNTGKIRVNGVVANMKEFSDAFNCKPEDPLNVQKRCDLWKA